MITPAAIKALRDETKKLSSTIEKSFWSLAKLLYDIYDYEDPETRMPLYMLWGYNKYSDYVWKELRIHPKRAEKLRKIWYRIEVELTSIPESSKKRLINLGYSKLVCVVRVLTLKNAEELAEWAEKKKVAEIEDEIKKFYHTHDIINSTDPKIDTLNVEFGIIAGAQEKLDVKRRYFVLYDDQDEVVSRAIARSEQLSHSTKDGHNLTIIAQSFLATHDFSFRQDKKALVNFLSILESCLGAKLIAIKDNEVPYGIHNVDELIECLEKR